MKWHSQNILKNSSNFNSLSDGQSNEAKDLSIEQINSLLYLRAIFKDEKEHVYAMDGILNVENEN